MSKKVGKVLKFTRQHVDKGYEAAFDAWEQTQQRVSKRRAIALICVSVIGLSMVAGIIAWKVMT